MGCELPSRQVRAAVRVLPVLLAMLLTPGAGARAEVPAGFQEFIVLGREYHTWEFLNHTITSEGDPSGASLELVSLISITASAGGQSIYYDHWEDGFEADILSPVQASTEQYELGNGERLTLASDGSGSGRNDFVPVNPRGTDLRYDGGDRIYTLGKPISAVHSFWPRDQDGVGNAWQLYPREAVSRFYSYRVPAAADLWDGPGGSYAPFKYAELAVAAFEDGTAIEVDNGADVVSVTLNGGDHWYSRTGCVNEDCAPARVIAVTTGMIITGNRPVLVGLLTAGEGAVANRFFPLPPLSMYGMDFVIPVEGGGEGEPDHADTNLYLYNPIYILF